VPLLPADLMALRTTISINLAEQFCVFTPLLCKITLHYFYEFYGFLAVQAHTVVVGYDTIYTGMGIIYFRGKCYLLTDQYLRLPSHKQHIAYISITVRETETSLDTPSF
jgi:hypothetical protein